MTNDAANGSRSNAVIETLYYLVGAFFFIYLFWYYMTGIGGPSLLAMTLVPVTFIVFTLDCLRKNEFYPGLRPALNYLIAAVYAVISILVSIYMHLEFEAIGTVRAGFANLPDLVFGALMVLLVLEYARKRYFALFVINVVLIVYCLYGWAVPGMFNHPGFEWQRVITAMSTESATGVFSRLPQLALTLIGSFILVLSILRAFGCVDSILKVAGRIATRSPHAVPMSAVLGSLGVATVSGSGAANAITIGSATIPAMIGGGMPRANAAAIESSASLGGQLMPPIMGISAFLMAEFMGVSYFDVVARGYAPAIVYFSGVAAGVYLLSVRHSRSNVAMTPEPIVWTDWLNLVAFLMVVGGLILLMALVHMAPMFAAMRVFLSLVAFLFLARLAAPLFAGAKFDTKALVGHLKRFIDSFASMTGDLTLLLATLSIMVGVFEITGVPTKIGFLLLEAAGVNLFVMALVAFLFGAFLGTGLPPAPTYILTALVIAPPMIRVGVDPWCVHFFAFFLAVWGELTPPTSVVAAVTAKIADASFLGTLFRAVRLCAALFILMAAAFVRPDLVLDPGVAQLGALAIVSTTAVAVSFSLLANFSDRAAVDCAVRIVLGALALFVLFIPSKGIAALGCIPIAAIIGYWVLRRRNSTPQMVAAAKS